MKCSVLRTLTACSLMLGAAAAQLVGPSTSAPCYVLPDATLPPGSVSTVALVTTGDSIGGYRMVGIPDGMGVLRGPGGVPTLVVTHEIGAADGIVRAHGSTGAFISRWALEASNHEVLAGRDHNTSANDVYVYSRAGGSWSAQTFAWDRFCSADLAAPGAYSFAGVVGTEARIFLSGEETRPPFATRHGAAWAHIVSGPSMNESWELPHLGQCAFENVVASPFSQPKTIVMCLDDSDAQVNPALTTQPSEMYVYIGNKRANGNVIEKAGLVGGTLYGVRVLVNNVVVPAESNNFGFGSSAFLGTADFELVSFGDASTFEGATQQANSIAWDIFRMQRVEDGGFDPRPGFENDFYWVTTASGSTNSRLWRLRFHDLTQPELGGRIEIILNGSEGQRNLDNMCVDSLGRVLMQEDTGSSTRLAKTWMYDLENGRMLEIAAHNPDLFSVGSPNFLTTNEEASGVTPAFDILGEGWYYMCTQNHAASADPELVEGGQLLAIYVSPTLGREFALWYSSPVGPGSAAIHHRFGQPFGTFFSPVTFTAGNFPNGAFYGIDIAFNDLLIQASIGAPFFSSLDASGSSVSNTFVGLPPLTLYGVALDNVFSATPRVSAPVSHLIP